MKRFLLALALAATILGSMTVSKTASAQEILLEGPLAGEPAVRKLIQYRSLRVSIGPQVGMTILNDYMHNILLGGRVEFNVFDWLGIGGVAYYAFNITTKLTDHIEEANNIGGNETVPSESNWPSYTGSRNFKYQVGLLKGMYLGQLSLVPFRGKMSMFEKLFVGIDWEIFVGGGAVQFEERKYCSLENENCGEYKNPDGTIKEGDDIEDYRPERAGRVQGVFTVGTGFGAYFNDWFAVHIEYRLTPFRWNAAGTDEAGQSGSQWHQISDEEDAEGNPIYHWEYMPGGKEGDYPDGKINKDDRNWNMNQSIAIGFLFHFPLKPSIAN